MDTTDTQSQPVLENGAGMTPEQALQLIAEGKPIHNTSISGLKLTGDFAQPVVFQNVELKRFKIVDANLQGGLNLNSCQLHRPLIGANVTIGNVCDLRGSTLYRAEFGKVQFLGNLRMDNVVTESLCRFVDCEFHGTIRVWEARFKGWLELNKSTFHKKVDLRSFHADEGLQSSNSIFKDDLLLRGSTVSKKLEFSGCQFNALVDFSKAKLHDVIYLESIQQGPQQCFAFRNALFSRMLIGADQLEGRIAAENKKHHAEAAEEYGLLKRNFQILSRYDEEDWAFYRFKVNKRKARPTSWAKPWTMLFKACEYWFLDRGCGYGAKPFRAVATAMVLMTLFAVVYAFGWQNFTIDQPPIPHQPMTYPMNQALFGLLTSVSVFTAGFTGEHLSNAQGWPLLPLAVEALMGTMLWGLFIVAFSRKVIR